MQPNTTITSNLVLGSGVSSTYTPGVQITSNLTAGAGLPGAAGVGVPTGGTAGQVLAKIDSTNYNTQWVAQTGGGGTGDMTKAVYDVDNNGIVDNSQALNGQAGSYYLNRTNQTGTQSADTITDGTTNKAYTAAEKTKLAAITGTNTGDQTITLTSDVTGSGTGSFATTIANNAVTNAKAAQMAANTFKANNTGAIANASDITVAQAKTMLNLTGTNSGDQTITLTGDVTGSGTGSFATTLATVNSNVGSFGSASSVASQTVNAKGLTTAASSVPILIAESQVTSLVFDLASKQPNLTIASSQTTSFTATANTYYPVNSTSGAITVTLPATNTTGQQIVVKKTDASTNIVTLSGTINGTASSSLPLRLQDQGKVLIADGTGNWNIYAGDLSLATTDARYVAIGGINAGTGISISGSGTIGSPYVVTNTGGSGGNTTNVTINTTKIDTVNAGTTAYGALGFTPNGTNTVATVSNGSYATGTLRVWLYGQLQTIGTTGDVIETNPAAGTFTFAVAPPSGAPIVVAYVVSSTSSGNIVNPYATKTTAYTLALTDKFIDADATSSAFSITLPSVSTAAGYEFCIKKVDSSANNVTVVGTIDGATNYVLTAQYRYVRVASNGTTWRIWGNN